MDVLRNFSSNADVALPQEKKWKDPSSKKNPDISPAQRELIAGANTNDEQIKEAFQYVPLNCLLIFLRYNPQLESLAWTWIEEVLGEKVGDRSGRLISFLKTGSPSELCVVTMTRCSAMSSRKQDPPRLDTKDSYQGFVFPLHRT